MSEREDIKAVVRVLSKIPPKSLRIVELLNQIPVVHGDLDLNVMEKLGSEIEEAKKEAEAYKHATEEAVRAILRLDNKGD
jgi:hypothetical protein